MKYPLKAVGTGGGKQKPTEKTSTKPTKPAKK